MNNDMRKLFLLLLIAGGFGGLYLATRKSPREKLLQATADLIAQEARRLEKPIDTEHLALALERFGDRQLELFHRFVQAVIHRDDRALLSMKTELQTELGPVLREGPEWKRYQGIVIPT